MAAYNAWANRRLYDTAGKLSDEDYRADLGAFFKSVHGTLNHLMVGDLLWLARFREEPMPALKLNQVLYEDRAELEAARRTLDDAIIRYCAGLTEAGIEAEFTYRMVSIDAVQTQRRGPAMSHFFNHQTHHRGQVHALLTRLTGEAPPLDLIYYLREVA
jgi:uncharacterized damage-inducible protein DinB